VPQADAELEFHIRGFLTAVNERPEELMAKHFAKVDQPTLREPMTSGATSIHRRGDEYGRSRGSPPEFRPEPATGPEI
jgi:hypothetical protein